MSPPTLRPTGGIDDLLDLVRQVAGEGESPVQVRRCTVGWSDDTGTGHVTITPGQDVDLHVTTAQGYPLTARLAASGGVWRVPAIGEECLVLADPADWDTPGGPIAFCRHRLPPSALTATRAVVEIPTGGELYVGDGATHAAAREGDAIDPGSLGISVGTPVPNTPSPGLTTVPVTFTYTPPSGAPQTIVLTFVGTGLAVAAVGSAFDLGGVIDAGSEKVKIE